jgi:pyocin large subunit-like protein
MVWKNHSYEESILDAINVFDNRVLKYDKNDLFLTNFSKKESIKLKKQAMEKIDLYKKIHNFL